MGAEDSKKEEIHLRGLGKKNDQKKYSEKLQKLKNTLTLDAVSERKYFSKNLSEDPLIGLEIDMSEETSVTSNIEIEESLPIVNCLFEARLSSESKFLTELINSEDNVNEVKFQRQKPLHIAINRGSIDMVRSLIDKGANVNISGRRDITSLHLCVKNNRLEIAQLLIAEGADINAKNWKGETPLYLAVILDQTEVVKLFIENGADATIKNNAGMNIASLDKSSLSSEMQYLVDFEEMRIPIKLAMIANRSKASHPTTYNVLKLVNQHRYGFCRKDKNTSNKRGSINR